MVVLFFCAPLFSVAQSSTATLSGTVEDQKGAVIAGANIALVNPARGSQSLATTNDEGRFVFPSLPPGHYSVTATRDGFAPQTKTVVLNVNDQVLLRITLNIGSVTQRVEILNDAPLIDESPAVSTVIDRSTVENQPLNGRSFQPLIALTPGVVLTRSTFTDQGQFSVNGQRTDSNYFTVDGTSANIGVSLGTTITQTGAGSIPGFSASGGTNNLVSIDAMEEFKIMTSTFAPEFGRTPGAQVQIITRSGTNRFSGTLFEYFRNDVLDANDWFGNRLGVKAPMRQNDFGGVLSGPILLPRLGEGGRQPWYNGRNRTFFFFSYEGLRLRQPQVRTTLVPSLATRNSAIASIRPYLNAFPLPNGPLRTLGFAEFNAGYSNPTTLDATSIRIDHLINNRFALFGRYNYAPSSVVERGGVGTALNHVVPQSITTQTLTLGLTATINPTTVSETRANYSRNQGAFSVRQDTFGGAVPLPASAFPPAPYTLDEALLVFTFLQGNNASLNLGNNASHLQQQLNFTNNLTKILSAHQLKFGVDYRQLTPYVNPRKYQQSAFFNGVTAANGAATPGTGASGTVNSGRIVVNDKNKLFITNFSAYGQDTWHLSQRFTLTYGLRWDVNPPPSGEADLITLDGLDNLSTATVAPLGTPLYATTYGNFAPRVGVAYHLSQTPGRETIVRGGVGIFYDLGIGNLGNAAFSFPYGRTRNLPLNTPFPFSAANAAPLSASFDQVIETDINIADRNLKLPRVYQWNIALEQSLGASQTVSLSYVGAAGRRLLRQEQLSGFHPRFRLVNITRNSGASDYHGMQLQFSRRLSRGLRALASYTWSHSLDNASTDAVSIAPGERIDPNLDRGPSDFDIHHTLTGAVSYTLPEPNLGAIGNGFLHDWSLDAMLTSRSAAPVNITVTRNLGFGNLSFRPDLIDGVPLYIADPTLPRGTRINRLAFVIPTALRQGNLGRNALRGFPVWQVDMALRRQFSLTDKVSLQFRTEFFNIFNHPNFGDPVGSLTNASFGQSTAMLNKALGAGGGNGGFNPLYQVGGPRSIQFALKLSF